MIYFWPIINLVYVGRSVTVLFIVWGFFLFIVIVQDVESLLQQQEQQALHNYASGTTGRVRSAVLDPTSMSYHQATTQPFPISHNDMLVDVTISVFTTVSLSKKYSKQRLP